MNKLLSAAAVSAMLFMSGAAVAGDAGAGKTKYAMCAGCHGTNGVSASPTYPSLAGQDATYVKDKLNKYRSGELDNATMKAMAAGLSDADIDNLSAFVATLKP